VDIGARARRPGDDRSPGTAVIVGASSGIGEALAKELHRRGWRLALLARRLGRLEALRAEVGAETIVRAFDVSGEHADDALAGVLDEIGNVDVVVISAGTGHLNPALVAEPDEETIRVNVRGFAAAARTAMAHFLANRSGHLIGITSVAALRANHVGAIYAASKAFQSVYLDGLRELAARRGHRIAVTEIQPGFVDTAMMKIDRPMSAVARRLLVASPDVAARQIARTVLTRPKHAYVTRRYRILAWLLRLLPRPG
jgi:NADP-dependent 3-hydroxy acid dehydrogenase YdfG